MSFDACFVNHLAQKFIKKMHILQNMHFGAYKINTFSIYVHT